MNKEKLCDHVFEVADPDTDCMCRFRATLLPNAEINRKQTLTVGWSKFPNMQKAPGASMNTLLDLLLGWLGATGICSRFSGGSSLYE